MDEKQHYTEWGESGEIAMTEHEKAIYLVEFMMERGDEITRRQGQMVLDYLKKLEGELA